MFAPSWLNSVIAKPSRPVKLLVSLVVFLHLSAILIHVISGGGPLPMKQLGSHLRPYLKTMWLDNAYRFYAPDPGNTEVFWYKLQYEDGTTRWTQVPRREDFYLRMPFQRHMSLALLVSQCQELKVISASENPASVASFLVNNVPTYKTMLTVMGEIYMRSYARHLGRIHARHPESGVPLASMESFFVSYVIRTPEEMRQNVAMYDPRKLTIHYICTFSPDGVMSDFQSGFRWRGADDLFVEMMQNELLPLVEANARLPAQKQKTIWVTLRDNGIPYPLIQPLEKLSEEERQQFFTKPFDRESLLQRYANLTKRQDKNTGNKLPLEQNPPSTTTPPPNTKTPDKPERGIQ
jgi:hypothetical protein